MQARKLSAAKALSALWLCSLTGAGLAFFTQVVLAQQLGADEYGEFASALALATLLAPIAGFGVAPFWLKAYGVEGWGAKRWIPASLQFTAISSIVVMVLLICIAAIVKNEESKNVTLIAISLFSLGQAAVEMVSSKYQLEERYVSLSMWQMMPHLIRFSLILLLSLLTPNHLTATSAALCYSFVAATILASSVKPLTSLKSGTIDLKGHSHNEQTLTGYAVGIKTLAQQAWPYGIGAFAHLIYFQSNLIFVKHFDGDSAAGNYSVAVTIITASYLIPTVFYQKFMLPKIHRWSVHNKNRFHSNYKQGNLIMGLFGTFAMTGIWLLGDYIIDFFFGAEYQDSKVILSILAATIPLFSIALNAGATLSTQNFIRIKVKYMAIVAVTSITLSVAAIQLWAAPGAAAATLACNALLLFLYVYGAENKVFKNQKIA